MPDPIPSLISSPDTADSRSPLKPSELHWPTPAVNDMGERKTVEEWDDWTARMKGRHANGNGHGPSLSVEARRSAPSDSAKSTPTPAPSSRTDSPMSPTSAPFSTSPEIQSLRDAVSCRLSSLVDFLASRTATPASAGASPTNATSGKIAGESFGTFDPALPSLRTSEDSSLPLPLPRMVSLSGDFFSIAFCQTWPRFGTLASGTLYRQPTLARHTDAIASGSSASMNWPTATASDAHTDNLASTQQSAGSMHSVTLPQAVTRDWPTAAARDYKGARSEEAIAATGRNPMTNSLEDAIQAVERSGPPRTASGPPDLASDSTGGSRAESLDTTAKGAWPTPNRLDYVNGETQEQFEKRRAKWASEGINLQMPLKTAINFQESSPKGSAGKLNPSWVETLMGLPMGWTQLSHKFVKPKRGTP